jgi:ABC-type lipoprotein release transport system permease subunit
MIRVVGIVSTGSDEVDAGICQVPIGVIERLTGRPGPGEITITLADWRTVETERAQLERGLAPGDEVMTWKELTPDFEGHMRQDTAASRIVTAIIILIVLLGVTSAQLAGVLERRREFAVLAALGMSGRRMAGLVLQEALVLGLAGGLAGLAIGGGVVWHFARVGLDFRRVMGGSYALAGLLVDPVIYTEFGAWLIVEALSIALIATLLASLYPARFASRTDPAVALRVAQ